MRKQSEAIFVVQKHSASHLHYDFRLELGEKLKSWALPKGPSMDASEKRLAIQVEDHDLDYASFEGEIPEGHYGAGKVIIWDTGKWTWEEEPSKQLRRGILKFTLHGKRLKGKFNLIRMKEKQWLLIKEKDMESCSGSVTDLHLESVVSGKKIEDI